MTTHSPVALRELNGSQLFVLRAAATTHAVLPAGRWAEMVRVSTGPHPTLDRLASGS